PLALGVLLHAPNASAPTANRESSLNRFVAMVPPPRPPATSRTRGLGPPAGRPGHADARLATVHPRRDRPGVPAPGRSGRDHSRHGAAGGRFRADSGRQKRCDADLRRPSCTIAPMFERSALPSGPRVISARLTGARSVSVAAYVLAGSRLETPAEAGVAHFMEHITFKGTARFPSTRSISEAIEGVGGSFNAAPDRDRAVCGFRVPRREAPRAMDVIGELIVRPTLADAEIAGERAVIVEEIRS